MSQVNRPGIAGSSNFQIGWGHDKQNDEYVFASLTFGSPEVRERAVRMVMYHEGQYASRWATVASISAKIGCS